MALLCIAVAIPADDAVAQQKQQVSFKSAAANSNYTQQQNLTVGDVPNHIVRIFELHRTFPNAATVIGGLKLLEEWDRGIADITDGNGTATVYTIYVTENGDKLSTRTVGAVQTNSGKLTATQVGTITNGTGRLAGIQGSVRITTTFDPQVGFNESQTEIEYMASK